MSNKSTLLAFLVSIAFLYATPVVGQEPVGQTLRAAAVRPTAKISRAQASLVTAELKKQQRFLSSVASRYEAVSTYDFTPLLSYSYVWSALRENRSRLHDPGRRLTSAQEVMLTEGYDLLESDVLLSFMDHQLTLLNETLELNEMQQQEMQNALAEDLGQKQALLAAKGIDSRQFVRRVDSLSAKTEKKILAILFPEQRRMFHKQIVINRDRLLG